jgi:hypothetical protein
MFLYSSCSSRQIRHLKSIIFRVFLRMNKDFMDYFQFISLMMVTSSWKFPLLFLGISRLDHYTCQHINWPHPHSPLILYFQILDYSLQYYTSLVIKHHRLISFSLDFIMKNIELLHLLTLNFYWLHYQFFLDWDLD